MKSVNVKLVGDSVVIVKCSNDTHDYHTLYNYEVNRLSVSRKLEVIHSAQIIHHDLSYSVLVPKNLSEEDRIDILESAIKRVDKEERNDEQQWNIKMLIIAQTNLYRLYQQ